MTQDTPSIAASEGDWIEWKGGRCPVRSGTLVDVRHRDGGASLNVPAGHYTKAWRDAEHRFWASENHHSDIIAYRIVRTALQEQSL
jgi:hypothetical protein